MAQNNEGELHGNSSSGSSPTHEMYEEEEAGDATRHTDQA